MRVQLRALDAEVLDAEHALAVPGDDDVADLLARTEALRERGRGLVNLVAERGRGLDRELAAVADEGVVETLVAEAAHVRDAAGRGRRRLRRARADARRGRSGRGARSTRSGVVSVTRAPRASSSAPRRSSTS